MCKCEYTRPDTLWRVASGPGADLSCLRQIPAPGPRKVRCERKLAFHGGAVSHVRVFFELDVKKIAKAENKCEKDVKLRNHFVSNRFFVILVKNERKEDPMKFEKLEN